MLETIQAFEAASGVEIPYKIVGRRAGDIAASFAEANKAREELGWEAEYDLQQMCEDVWRWQSRHPNGYAD